jgi:uncharacterized protein (TIGR03382 family)
MKSRFVLFTVLTALTGLAGAATISLTPGKDNTLYESATGSLSDGLGSYMFVGRTNQASLRRGLVSFNLTSIPTGSTINSVRLTLHVSRAASGTEPVELHMLNADWGEGSSNSDTSGGGGRGAAATTGDATWLDRVLGGARWNTAGGDFKAAASASTDVVGLGFYSFTSAGLVTDVQRWLDNSSTNFGWAIIGNETADGTAKRFDSRQNATAANRPTLTIDYTPTPAPGAIPAAALACAWLGRRRRQSPM